MKTFRLGLVMAALAFGSSGCMTRCAVYHAQHPAATDPAPWGLYLVLPLTAAADVATSPIQIPLAIGAAMDKKPKPPEPHPK